MYDRVIWPEKCDPKTSAIYALAHTFNRWLEAYWNTTAVAAR
jgi:hypothetical protein